MNNTNRNTYGFLIQIFFENHLLEVKIYISTWLKRWLHKHMNIIHSCVKNPADKNPTMDMICFLFYSATFIFYTPNVHQYTKLH